MKIAVLGSGGREHSIGLKLLESSQVKSLFFIPGNPGTAEIGENRVIDLNDFEQIAKFCFENRIDMVVVGPEDPLVNGITDFLTKKNINVFGPSQKAANLEGSKAFSKDFMRKYNIPTAAYENFKDYESALKYIKTQKFPLVVKASGLAAGKGAVVCATQDEAERTLKEMMQDKVFGNAGCEVVIEEFLNGVEASIFAISDGDFFKTFVPAQDHKQAFDNDKGLNTGGMGSYAPAPIVDEIIMSKITKEILQPIFTGMKKEGTPYKGILFVGLMITEEGPKVIEFNCRFGDPETQVILPLYNGDLAKLFLDSILGRFSFNAELPINNGYAVCLIQTSGGYPASYEKGKLITGIDKMPKHTSLIHAGTKLDGNNFYTNGGRVLGLVSQSESLAQAIDNVYEANKIVDFENKHIRNDIGKKGLEFLNKKS